MMQFNKILLYQAKKAKSCMTVYFTRLDQIWSYAGLDQIWSDAGLD